VPAPDAFAAELIAAYVSRECKGKLFAVAPEYRRVLEAAP
jgi:hypothetical protein